MNHQKLLWPVLIALIALLTMFSSLQLALKPTYAQDPPPTATDIEVIKILNQTSPVVQIGQFISFTIFITNNHPTLTLTHATLFDDYNENILGGFSMLGSNPPAPTAHDTGNGTLTWGSLISMNQTAPDYFSELPPHQGVSLTMQFQVQHPPVGGLTIVNRAQIRDAVFGGGGGGDGSQIEIPAPPITGGRFPIFKQLDPPGQIPVIGDSITYTIWLTNEGAVAITDAVIADSYNPTYLLFITATPTLPTTIDDQNGILTWTNLASPPLAPGQAISVTTTFELLQDGIEATNRAEVISARDFFNNDLAPGFGEVGIIIVSSNTTTDNNYIDTDDDDDDDDDQDTTTDNGVAPLPATTIATAIPAASSATITGSQSITGSNAPRILPETGNKPPKGLFGPLLLLILLTGSYYFLKIKKIAVKD